MKVKFAIIIFVVLSIVLITASTDSNVDCKELNQYNCYVGKNEGKYCNKKDQTTHESRWYYDKGACKKFVYKGCYGNRNRFCTKETCERRCLGE